jgi:hypothetical protein
MGNCRPTKIGNRGQLLNLQSSIGYTNDTNPKCFDDNLNLKGSAIKQRDNISSFLHFYVTSITALNYTSELVLD